MQYDPNNIPTFNYYAYSTLNNNLVDDNFYINNKPQDFNQYKPTQNNVKMPEHIKRLELKQLEIQQEENNKKDVFNDHYQKDILDYYQDADDEKEHPFKNTIKKYNSKGKFVLDIT